MILRGKILKMAAFSLRQGKILDLACVAVALRSALRSVKVCSANQIIDYSKHQQPENYFFGNKNGQKTGYTFTFPFFITIELFKVFGIFYTNTMVCGIFYITNQRRWEWIHIHIKRISSLFQSLCLELVISFLISLQEFTRFPISIPCCPLNYNFPQPIAKWIIGVPKVENTCEGHIRKK